MVVVQPAAVDPDHDLGARPLERVTLEVLERITAHLAVEAPGARGALEGGERRLVSSAAGADHQTADASRPRHARRERPRAAADRHARADLPRDRDLVVEQHWALRIGFGHR